MKETAPTETTPEQLLQILESQLAARRSQSKNAGRNRAIILVAGVLFIVVATAAALFVLDQMLNDLRSQGAASHAASTEERKF